MRDVRESMPSITGAPSGPKLREWGKPQNRQEDPAAPKAQGFGKGTQGYSKPVGFVKAEDGSAGRDPLGHDHRESTGKTDEELEAERKEMRRQEEELSFKDVRIFFSPVDELCLIVRVFSVSVDTNLENGHASKRWSVPSVANGVKKRPRNAIGLRFELDLTCGMTMKVMSCSM